MKKITTTGNNVFKKKFSPFVIHLINYMPYEFSTNNN